MPQNTNQIYFPNMLKKAVENGISKDSIFCLFYIKSKTCQLFFTQPQLNQYISDYYKDEKGKDTEPYKLRDKMVKEGLFKFHPKMHIPSYSIIGKKELNKKIGNENFRVKLNNNEKITHGVIKNELSVRIDRRDSFSKVAPKLKEYLGNTGYNEYSYIKTKRRESLAKRDCDYTHTYKLTTNEKKKISLIQKDIIGSIREFSYVRYARMYGYSTKTFKKLLNEMTNLGLIDFVCGVKKRGQKMFSDACRFTINDRVVQMVEEGLLNVAKEVVHIFESPMSIDKGYTAVKFDAIPYYPSTILFTSELGYEPKKVLV